MTKVFITDTALRVFWMMILLATVGVFSATADECERCVYPLPITETRDVLAAWLENTGFRIRRANLPAGGVELDAVDAAFACRVLLTPQTVLATEVQVRCSGEPRRGRDFTRQLKAYLSDYVRNVNAREHRIPAAVSEQARAVVCIQARTAESATQYTGFVVDGRGLILSTTHEIQDFRDITVTRSDGLTAKGEVVRYDPHRDLALIRTDPAFDVAIRLAEGREYLEMGERVYSVGCPENQNGTMFAGIVSGLPRRVDDLAFWQVDLQVYPGSSGSPVFDEQGRLVGVVKGRYRGTLSIGFLIPVPTILAFLTDE